MKLLMTVAAMLLFPTAPVVADDIIQIDVVSSVPDAAPVLQDDETQATLDLIRQADSWLHTVTFGGADVLKRFDISVSGTNGSTAPRIEVDYPYFINGTVSVIVESDPQVDVDANAVQALYAVDITGMTEQELIDFNAKARAIATQRIAHLNGSFDQSSVWDVQADYKYLESAVAMAQGLHIAPDASVLKAKEWMRDAIDEKADVVQTAVTTVNAKREEGRRRRRQPVAAGLDAAAAQYPGGKGLQHAGAASGGLQKALSGRWRRSRPRPGRFHYQGLLCRHPVGRGALRGAGR